MRRGLAGEEPSRHAMGAFDVFFRSEPGAEGDDNEDAVIADSEAGVFVIADGLGGRPGGAKASRIAAEAFVQAIRSFEPSSRLDEKLLREAVVACNRAVRTLAGGASEGAVPGTTLCAAVVRGKSGRVVHLGDSRAYLLAGGTLIQLTRDHTLVEELIQRNHLRREAARDYPLRHVLSRCLGACQDAEPDVREFTLEDGAWLVLTTDGLWEALGDGKLEAIVSTRAWAGARELCDCVADEAVAATLRDNASVLVARGVAGAGEGSSR